MAVFARIMLIRGLITDRGVFPPEQIDPGPFLDLMAAHGTPTNVIDLPPEE